MDFSDDDRGVTKIFIDIERLQDIKKKGPEIINSVSSLPIDQIEVILKFINQNYTYSIKHRDTYFNLYKEIYSNRYDDLKTRQKKYRVNALLLFFLQESNDIKTDVLISDEEYTYIVTTSDPDNSKNSNYKKNFMFAGYKHSDLKLNKQKLLYDIIENGYERGSTQDILYRDDLDEFKERIKKIDIHNETIPIYTIGTKYIEKPCSYLAAAAFFGACSIFEFLVRKNLALDLHVIMYAVIGGCFSIIQMLIRLYANLDQTLALAIKFHRYGVIDYICNHSEVRTRVFVESFSSYFLVGCNLFLERYYPKNMYLPDSNEYSIYDLAILHACKLGNKGLFDRILSKHESGGSEIPIRYDYINESGKNCFHYIAKNGCKDILESIHDIVGDKFSDMMMTVSNKGLMPIHYAAFYDQLECILYMIDERKDLEYNKDQHGRTIYNILAQKGYVDTLKYLFNRNPDIFNICGTNNINILHSAVKWQKMNVVEFVLLNDVDGICIKVVDDKNETPLHKSFRVINSNIAEILKQKYSDVFEQYKKSLIALATKSKSKKLMNLFEESTNIVTE